MKFLAAALIVAGLGTGCGSATTAMVPAGAMGTSQAGASQAGKASGGPVPQVVGKGLAVAVGELAKAGHTRVKSTDVSGRGRIVLARRDWQVCTQRATPSQVDLGVVKVGEPCPVAEQPVAPGAMPALTGKSIRVARQSLPGRTSVRITDATGRNRVTLRDTAWQICTQSPSAGVPLNGQPVSLTVVKYGEKCP